MDVAGGRRIEANLVADGGVSRAVCGVIVVAVNCRPVVVCGGIGNLKVEHLRVCGFPIKDDRADLFFRAEVDVNPARVDIIRRETRGVIAVDRLFRRECVSFYAGREYIAAFGEVGGIAG